MLFKIYYSPFLFRSLKHFLYLCSSSGSWLGNFWRGIIPNPSMRLPIVVSFDQQPELRALWNFLSLASYSQKTKCDNLSSFLLLLFFGAAHQTEVKNNRFSWLTGKPL
jgi:hypothetical protein